MKIPGNRMSLPGIWICSSVLPVVIDQSVASCAQFFHIGGHDTGSVIGSVFVPIADKMAIVTPVAFPMV